MKTDVSASYQTYCVGKVWYIKRQNEQIWGQGESLEQALGNLQQRQSEFERFCATTGLPVVDVQAAGFVLRVAGRRAWRFLRIVVIVALCAVPVSYAISSGITRGLENAEIKGGRVFWSKVEESILDMGRDDRGMPPEKAAALHHAVGNIVARLRPFTSQLSLLFVSPSDAEEAAASTERQ